MNEILLAVVAGAIVGFFFSAIKLPLPAPPVISGSWVSLVSTLAAWLIKP